MRKGSTGYTGGKIKLRHSWKRIGLRLPLILVIIDISLAACAHPASEGSGLGTGNGADPAASQVATASRTQQTYEGTPVGSTEEGHAYRGDPDAAVTIEEYSDYLCPFCARHVSLTMPTLIEQYVSTGQVQYLFRDMPLASLHPTAEVGHAAARCVGEQGAPLYWKMHDELFRLQGEWSGLPDPGEFLAAVAREIGADTVAYQACVSSGRAMGSVQDGIAAGQALGFNGTPSFRFIRHEDGESYTLVGAQSLDVFSEFLDAVLAGEAPPQAEEADEPELPYWANAEGLAPDPDRPGYTMAGDAFKGDPDAPLVVVEFSDFQCPACRRHALETQSVVDETFVETGEIMWVFKHLPLREHPQAAAAAAAAECAGDQGRFWEMHDLLFEAQDGWANVDPDPALLSLARELDLDAGVFRACLSGRASLERVLGDLYDAQGVAQSTPTFVGLHGGRGTVVRGTRAAADFVPLLWGLLGRREGE